MNERPFSSGRGFTLVELLVALAIMALMAALSWQGLDGMMRTLKTTARQGDQVLTLDAALTQWQTDWDALIETPSTTALDWDGNTLRMTRTGPSSAPGAFLVCAWTLRDGQWLRWQSAPVGLINPWQEAWQQAAQWGQGADSLAMSQEVNMAPADAWQLFYYRDNAWTNSLSSGASANNAATAPLSATSSPLPQAVKLMLTLSSGQAISGQLTRDWIRPLVGGGKS
jgi:general secretion pathway protein J